MSRVIGGSDFRTSNDFLGTVSPDKVDQSVILVFCNSTPNTTVLTTMRGKVTFGLIQDWLPPMKLEKWRHISFDAGGFLSWSGATESIGLYMVQQEDDIEQAE